MPVCDGACFVQSDARDGNNEGLGVKLKWLGPLALLAALFVGDQIRINRPGHKYRLTLEVETPAGVKSASGVISVHPDRGYSRHGHTSSSGDAVFVDLGDGKNLVALLAHIDKLIDLDDVNFVALRAYKAAGRNVSFNDMNRMTGAVPVTGALVPVLVTFGSLSDPASARTVKADDLESMFGKGFHLWAVSAEVVPNGFWPLDFGGPLGEPVTRGISQKLKWLNASPTSAEAAIRAAGLPIGEPIDAMEAFTRK
jgi:hypothetical protein